jgi:lipid-A-disaccharide synthase
MEKLLKEIRGLRFYIPVAHPSYKEKIRKKLGALSDSIIFTSSDDYNIWAASDLALSKTGTSVQELMALGVPTIAFYTVVSSLWYNLTKRYIMEFEYVAFPNIIAGRFIIPEFIQDDFKSSGIFAKAVELLNDDEKRAQMRRELVEIRDGLYRADALERAARIALELAEMKN